MTKKTNSFLQLKQTHLITGLTISLFIFTHLLNQLAIVFGEDFYLSFMATARLVYRNILVETILLLAVLLQVLSGVKLLGKKWKRQLTIYDKLLVYSGLYLSFFLVAHVAAVLITRYLFELDTNLYFGTAVLNAFPYVLLFAPYYGLAIIAFFVHIAIIYRTKRLQAPNTDLNNVNRQTKFIISIGIVLSLLILSNMIYTIDIPLDYRY